MFEYLLFTYFFEINGVMQKKYSVEHGQECPYQFKQLNEPSRYRGEYKFYTDTHQLIKKAPKEVRIIAISCKEKHSIRKD